MAPTLWSLICNSFCWNQLQGGITVKTAILAFTTILSTTLWAQGAPGGAQITDVSMAGPGCRDASASVTLSPDNRALSILFDNFILEASASNVNQTNLRAETHCTVHMGISIPRGWQMSLVGVDYRGFADIPAQAIGYQRFLYQIPGMQIVSMRDATARGPYSNNYTFSAMIKPGRSAWTPCGATHVRLPMTAVLGVAYQRRGHYPQALMMLDSQDLDMAQKFQVAWQRCR